MHPRREIMPSFAPHLTVPIGLSPSGAAIATEMGAASVYFTTVPLWPPS
jgi:hypothetical protein